MTLLELITQVNAEKPNSFSDDKLTEYVNELEADIAEFLGGEIKMMWEAYVFDRDKNEDLLAIPPYDRLYKSYLKGKIDYDLEEHESAANNMAQFNSDYADYKDSAIRKGFVRIWHPKRIKNVF